MRLQNVWVNSVKVIDTKSYIFFSAFKLRFRCYFPVSLNSIQFNSIKLQYNTRKDRMAGISYD